MFATLGQVPDPGGFNPPVSWPELERRLSDRPGSAGAGDAWVRGRDDKQFALNVVRWLAGALLGASAVGAQEASRPRAGAPLA